MLLVGEDRTGGGRGSDEENPLLEQRVKIAAQLNGPHSPGSDAGTSCPLPPRTHALTSYRKQ